MAYCKDLLRCVIWVAVLILFATCENPMPSMNSTDETPLQWYGSPTWSPTGEWIAYEYYGPDGPWGIWLVRPDGSENHFETRGIVADFSPDGKKLAFSRGEKIFVRDWETGEEVQLTYEGGNTLPTWSPDGKKILYNYDFNSLWLMNSDGSNNKELGQRENVAWREADWFPDFRILHRRRFNQDNEVRTDLFLMDSTGANEIRLTDSVGEDLLPKVSPNGKKIIWQRWLLAAEVGFAFWTVGIGVWQMNADGSDQKWLAEGFEPAWAPDGRHIIYRKDGEYVGGQPYDEDDPKVRGSLWIMNVETGEERQFLPEE